MRENLKENVKVWHQDWLLMDRLFGEWAKRYNLTYISLFTLYLLWQEGGCTPTYIAEFLSVTKQTMNSTLQRLEEKGIVIYRRNYMDKRSKIVEMTVEGRRFVSGMLKELYEMEERAFSCLSDEEMLQMVQLNRRLTASIRKEVDGTAEEEPDAEWTAG